jgi:hypothetical protein
VQPNFRHQFRPLHDGGVGADEVFELHWGIGHLVTTRLVIEQAKLKRSASDPGSVILIARFDSAANLNVHLHCPVLDGVYRSTEGQPTFQEARGPSRRPVQGRSLMADSGRLPGRADSFGSGRLRHTLAQRC